jgi:integrase
VTATTNTFKAVAEEYALEQMKYKSEDYIEQFKRSMRKDIYKVIGHKPVKDVNSSDVLTIMKDTMVRVKKLSHYGTGEAAANQNRRFVSLVMKYAIVTLRADNDPTYAVRSAIEAPEIEHARPLEKDERIKLRTRLELYGGTITVRNACLAMMYSMLRASEIRRMQWSFVDFNEKVIEFPKASRRRNRSAATKESYSFSSDVGSAVCLT